MFTTTDVLTGIDPGPVRVVNPEGDSEFLLVCEHASNHFPQQFGDLGLDSDVRQSHVAWDPGAFAVADRLSSILNATLVSGGYSRLLYDCNRPPEAANAMPEKSEIFSIPGNKGLSAQQKQHRIDRVYVPFNRQLSAELDARNTPMVLVTMHSFTKIYHGKPRQVEIGILHDTDTRFADKILEIAPSQTDLNVQRNEPYGAKDGVTHTLKVQGIRRGILNVMIEIRNDLISTDEQQNAMAELIAKLLQTALRQMPVSHQQGASL